VEKQGVMHYELHSDGTKELIVHANSYKVSCVRLNLMAKEDGAINTTVISTTLIGELMISPSEKPTDYVVEVIGQNDCAY